MTIKVNCSDAKALITRLEEEKLELEEQIKDVENRRSIIADILEVNEETAQKWVIELPKEVLDLRTNEKTTVNWKRLVQAAFEHYQIPMSTDLMCNKLWYLFQQVPFERKTVFQNISAAMSVLEGKDGVLFRTKEKGKKGYIYGLKHFFDFGLKLKPNYLKYYRREEGDDEMLSPTNTTETISNENIDPMGP